MIELSHFSTFHNVIQELTTEDNLARYDSILLQNSSFVSLFNVAHKPVIPGRDKNILDKAPIGSLAHEYQAYLQHYDFDLGFFPFGCGSKLRPVEYAAKLLNEYHDFFHVLGEYEASDSDEIALESFLLGQLPVPFAVFFRACFANPEINAKKYKHLQDVHLAPISHADVARGKNAKILAFAKLEERLTTSVADLRKELAVTPRNRKEIPFSNTCGLHASVPFFISEAQLLGQVAKGEE